MPQEPYIRCSDGIHKKRWGGGGGVGVDSCVSQSGRWCYNLMVREESQEILKFSCNLSLVKTPTHRDSLSFKTAETLKNAVNEKDDTVS